MDSSLFEAAETRRKMHERLTPIDAGKPDLISDRPERLVYIRNNVIYKRFSMRPLATINKPHRKPTRRKVTASKITIPAYQTIRMYLSLATTISSLLLLQSAHAQQTLVSSRKLPDLASATSDEPVVVTVGQDAFLSCVAKNLQNYTIIWRFTNDANAPGADQANNSSSSVEQAGDDEQMGVILTAGKQRVIADDHFSVIQSHDTWLLKITNVRLSDTGTYSCQTNSEPKVRVLRVLNVIKPQAESQNGAQPEQLEDSRYKHFENIDYDFTDCCKSEFISSRCQRLCSFKQLASRYQSINIIHECFPSLPLITRCMVGGRNVSDCCQRRHIPAKCNSICGHQSDTISMSVQDQSYCADYSASIMSCVAEGISTLPSQPEFVIVEAVSSTTLKVSWQKVTDENELKRIDGWIINLTKLSSFEDTIATNERNHSTTSSSFSSSTSTSTSSSTLSGTALANLTIVDVLNNSSLAAMSKLLVASSGTISLKLNKHLNEFSIDNLKPYTVYQIQMFAYNSLGRSQLTDPIRALTLAPESELTAAGSSGSQNQDSYVEPNLPDTRKCCVDRGVTLNRCLDTLCDPVEADKASMADLMICAPWSNITFGCLSSRVDHSNCCKARGVTPFCLSICSGDIKRVDYRHFRCLTHMSSFTNCILESHNVLPSPPLNFTVGPITHTWAVLNWRPPLKHARSLQGFRIFWRKVEPATTDTAGSNATATKLMGDNSPGSSVTDEDYFYSSSEAATNPYLLDALLPETVYETFVVAVNKFGQSESSVRFVFQTLADPEKLINSEGLQSRLPLAGNTRANSPEQSFYNETACCANSGVHNACQQLCDYDLKVTDVQSLITNCNTQMPVILRCMAGSRNSVPCCRNRGVNDNCLNVCAGLTEHSPLVVATRCAADFGKIIRCLDEGSKQIPSAPIDLHASDVKFDKLTIEWRPANEDLFRSNIEYHVRYQQLQPTPDQPISSNDLSTLIAVVPLHPLEHNLVLSTNTTKATIDKLKPNSRYSIYVTAENSYGISLPSLVLVIQTPDGDSDPSKTEDFKRRATLGAPHSLEILRSDTESIVLKWIAPLFINNDAQVKYRVFYKLLNSSQNLTAAAGTQTDPTTPDHGLVQQISTNWTVLETADTTVLLKNLHYSSQYVITVQAFSKKMLGHMSEVLIANTARPVPPTLNQPLVINNPIEGHNITVMCLALGQPTPQISMFINGLLVQKRTQPYVVYHLVNLARGSLTITCFASNGHGKEYATVQSRTELSVKFPAKAQVKSRELRVSSQGTARMSCEVTGNPQPTVLWTFSPGGDQSKLRLITPNERTTTLLAAQFESPFTWTHTLTLRNVTQLDAGNYQCRAKNPLSESSDTVQLIALEGLPPVDLVASSPSKLQQLDTSSDLMECCKSQNVSEKCLPVCLTDGLDIEGAFKTPECQANLDKLMYCAADGSDHRNCCRYRQVPSSCLRWCSGAKLNIPALCFLSSAIDINQCFQEGRTLLPGPPSNVRVLLASESSHSEAGEGLETSSTPTTTTLGSNMFSLDKLNQVNSDTTNNSSVISSMVMMMNDQAAGVNVSSASSNGEESPSTDNNRSEPLIIEWDPPTKNPSLVQYYRIFWRPFGSRELSRTVTNLTWIRLNDLSMNKIYEFVVKAANIRGSSVYSDPLTVKPAEIVARANSLNSASFIWFMPSNGPGSVFGRVFVATTFATIFMFSSLAIVVLLERRGYLKRFASSKSNSSRISFANPTYVKDADGNPEDDNITWETGHSLEVLRPSTQLPPLNQQD